MKEFEKIIQKDIKLFNKEFKKVLSTKSKLLYKITNYISNNSGKKIRPICTILGSGLLNNITEKTYRSAILIELLHTATLIHDDIVDDAQLRRSRLSINTVWKNKMAVLTGDFFLAKGLQLAVMHKDYDVLKLISDVVQKIVEGELLQIEKTKKLDMKEEDYFHIIELKTSSLFQCAFQIGAIAANANKSDVKKLSNLGLLIGAIFQIKDDIIDYDITNYSGKKSGNDITEGKINLPLLYALNKMTLKEKNEVYRVLRKKKNSRQEIILVKEKVIQYKGIQEAEKKMNYNYGKAMSILQTFEFNSYNEAIKLLLYFLIDRKK